MISMFTVHSTRKQEIIDITENVRKIVAKCKLREGLCVVYVPHATAAIIINENWDPNINDDFLEALAKLIPAGTWKHDKVDDNGDAHIKSALAGPSETIMINEGKLLLGQWQNIMVADFDGPKERTVAVKIISG